MQVSDEWNTIKLADKQTLGGCWLIKTTINPRNFSADKIPKHKLILTEW